MRTVRYSAFGKPRTILGESYKKLRERKEREAREAREAKERQRWWYGF